MRDVFLTFLRLGSTSFGGPIAHLGYFRREFVERRAWLDEPLFAHIVALCSILPGPTSSQVGMLIGLRRAGPRGAVLAWLGFTLPSALLLTFAAAAIAALEGPGTGPPWLGGLLRGLTAAAAAVVAQAVLAMAKAHCTRPVTQTIAGASAALALAPGGSNQFGWLPIAAGAVAGAVLLRGTGTTIEDVEVPAAMRVGRVSALAAGALFIALVLASSLVAGRTPAGTFAATIVRAGSLVFGGGHVVLPLLQTMVAAGLISARDFYAGYGLTQAVPGPLFAFAAFLGAANTSALHAAPGALVATILIFVPSFLLVFAVLPGFNALHAHRAFAGALRGVNASVVGLLAAALYSPMILTLGASAGRLALAIGAFVLITAWKCPPWLAVAGAALFGTAIL